MRPGGFGCYRDLLGESACEWAGTELWFARGPCGGSVDRCDTWTRNEAFIPSSVKLWMCEVTLWAVKN